MSAFNDLLQRLLSEDAPHGWVSFVEGDPASVVWFASARNAAAWQTSQSIERIGTPFEYLLRRATADEARGLQP